MSLLTPAESHAIQSFIANFDNILSTPFNDHRNMYPPYDPNVLPLPDGRDALSKATKDLMSLDSDKWRMGLAATTTSRTSTTITSTTAGVNTASLPSAQQQQYHLQHPFPYTTPASTSNVSTTSFLGEQSNNNHHLSSNDPFGLFFKPPSHHPSQQSSSQFRLPLPVSMAPNATIDSPAGSSSAPSPLSAASLSSRSSSSESSTTTPTPPHFPASQPHPHINGVRPSSPFSFNAKRPGSSDAHTYHLQQQQHQQQQAHDRPSTKRQRYSPAVPAAFAFKHLSDSKWTNTNGHLAGSPHSTHSGSTTPQHQQPQPRPPKTALLSPSQKKANHIQSEQKRRANIRRGYEALCAAIPALREAIGEEAVARLEEGPGRQIGAGGKGRKGHDRSRGGSAGAAGEKIDARAGPRSENVVLSKTIEYIQELLEERTALLGRLARARSALPAGHPALTYSSRCYVLAPKASRHKDDSGAGAGVTSSFVADGSAPLLLPSPPSPPVGGAVPILSWEREWNGGVGWDHGEEEEEGEEEGEEGE